MNLQYLSVIEDYPHLFYIIIWEYILIINNISNSFLLRIYSFFVQSATLKSSKDHFDNNIKKYIIKAVITHRRVLQSVLFFILCVLY